ncbi:uncharacterized protein LOC113035575 isoform X1 [Astatotilapia calliptera]|uniref:uncharacterized protein LOC113035575 isoform X1 n=1 Tax=Astatotilapia calliptera TaxID=8154 RepID=UPI000E4262E0|nr:uncharacterized protein LOC113035575 isoform X1 [Astatotilapia calliptera]
MRATVIDRVIVHGMTMAEAGLRVRPNLSRFTVATIIRAFRQHNRVERMPHRGGRVAIFTAAQETLIVDMVRGNNLIRLREIRDKVIADNVNFESIDDVSLATIDRVVWCKKTRMKQVYRVPFERNSARHKDLRYEYVQVSIHVHSTVSGHTVLLSGLHYFWTILCYLIDCCSEHLCTFTFSQRILQLDVMTRPHEYLFLDEAGFNLQKQRQRGRNIIGQRAITEVPGQRGVILPFVRPWVWRGVSTGMLSLGLTTPNVSSPS